MPSLMLLLAGSLFSCVSMPNINICKEKSLTRARCTETLTGVGREINDTTKLHGKTWWESRITNVQMPVEDVTELKKFVLKLCEKYPKVCKENNTEQVIQNLDKQMAEVIVPETPNELIQPKRMALYWEKTSAPHPERKPWSDELTKIVAKDLAEYDKASDIEQFCPKYKSLNSEEKTKAVSELFVAAAFYESGYKPASFMRECRKEKCVYGSGCQIHPEFGYCMKGGHKLDGGIVISRGLMQMSLESALSYKCEGLKVPNDLHDPIKNLRCANTIMKKQINRTENKIGAKSNYWAVLKPTNKNQALIIERIKKHAPKCY